MEHSQHSPHRLFLLGLAATIILISVVALVALLLVGSGKHENNALVSNDSKAPGIATTAEITQDINSLNASLKQSAADQATADVSIKDKSVKVNS
jgi:hypothetical protein